MRLAAVLIPILNLPEPSLIFVRRAHHLRRSAGQIAFPGGMVEPHERDDPVSTALRETEEELGLSARDVAVVGRLPDVITLENQVEVAVIVGVVRGKPVLTIDTSEIVSFFEVPLRAIVAEGAVAEGFEHVAGRAVRTWQFDYEDMHVWGATARMLRDLVAALGDPASALAGALAGAGINLRRER